MMRSKEVARVPISKDKDCVTNLKDGDCVTSSKGVCVGG